MLILAIYTKLELYPHPVDLLMVHSVSFFGIHLQSRLDASIILSYPVSLLFPYWVYNSIILLVFPSHVERDDLAKVSLPGIAMLSLSRGWRFNPHPHTPQLLYTQTKKKKEKVVSLGPYSVQTLIGFIFLPSLFFSSLLHLLCF